MSPEDSLLSESPMLAKEDTKSSSSSENSCAENETKPQRKEKLKLLVSPVVIVSVACAWALSTQFSKTALNIDKKNFYAPFFMMWFNTCFNVCVYPAFLLFSVTQKKTIRESHRRAVEIFHGRGLTFLSILIYVVPFVLLWVAANYTYARSLGSISASVATSISSCNSALVYLLSIVLLKEHFVPLKITSVAFAVAGVAVMSFDGEIQAQPVGIALSVASAAAAAIYKVCFKKVIGQADLGQVSLFMTCIGTLNLFLNAVPTFILLRTPWEWVNWGAVPWVPLIAAGFLSLLYNFLVNFGIALLSPLVISVGMLIGIPLNTAIDVIFRDVKASVFFIVGTCLIVVSFVLIALPLEYLFKKIFFKKPEDDPELQSQKLRRSPSSKSNYDSTTVTSQTDNLNT